MYSTIWITNSISNDDLCYLKDTDGICAFKEDPSSHAIIVTRISNVSCLTLVKGASITSQGIQLNTGLLKEGDIITLDGLNGHVYSEKNHCSPNKSRTAKQNNGLENTTSITDSTNQLPVDEKKLRKFTHIFCAFRQFILLACERAKNLVIFIGEGISNLISKIKLWRRSK